MSPILQEFFADVRNSNMAFCNFKISMLEYGCVSVMDILANRRLREFLIR